jgi:hypothetical protein
MISRLASALMSVVLITANAQALTDLRGIRMELPSLFGDATARQIVENVASAHFNAILCTVHPSVLTDGRFAELLAAAHARGIAVHVVLSTIVAGAISPVSKPALKTNAVNSSGQLVSEWLCPNKPEVRRQVLNFAWQLSQLPIDGLQLDYIRFGPPDLCLCEDCRRDCRLWLKENPGRSREDWRDSVISSLVTQARGTVKGTRAGIMFSCSTWTVGNGQRKTNLTPEGEGYGWRQGQNFLQLRERVDFLRPMLYACMLGQSSDWIVEMTRLAIKNTGGKTAIVPGLALTIEEPWKACQMPRGDLTRIVPQILKAGAAGVAIFNYQSLFSPRYAKLGYLVELRALFPPPKGSS